MLWTSFVSLLPLRAILTLIRLLLTLVMRAIYTQSISAAGQFRTTSPTNDKRAHVPLEGVWSWLEASASPRNGALIATEILEPTILATCERSTRFFLPRLLLIVVLTQDANVTRSYASRRSATRGDGS